MALAYRERAGMIAALSVCICAWPVKIYEDTPHGHHPLCCANSHLEFYASSSSPRDPSTTANMQMLAHTRRDEIAKFHAGGG